MLATLANAGNVLAMCLVRDYGLFRVDSRLRLESRRCARAERWMALHSTPVDLSSVLVLDDDGLTQDACWWQRW